MTIKGCDNGACCCHFNDGQQTTGNGLVRGYTGTDAIVSTYCTCGMLSHYSAAAIAAMLLRFVV